MKRFLTLTVLVAVAATGLLLRPLRAANAVDTSFAVSGAGSTIVNGWYVNDSLEASQWGELSCELTSGGFASVFTGIPESLMTGADTIHIGTGFAMSSLALLNVPNDTVNNTPYDTIYFRYFVQNQGNATDSLYIFADVHDTSDGSYFTPVAFNIVKDTAAAVDSVVGLGWDTSKVDSAWYAIPIAQEQIDTFYVRVVVPGPSNASDGDSLKFTLHVRDSLGSGGYDAWPGSTATGHPIRTVLDTFTTPHLVHLHLDTLWEYGDYQMDTAYLTINSPIMRLKKRVEATGDLPGDTLTYTVFYENDGTAGTEDTVVVVDVLPRGVTFLDTAFTELDEGVHAIYRGVGKKISTSYRLNEANWIDHMPDGLTAAGAESLLQITALRFSIPPGIGVHDTTGEAGSDSKVNVLADGDSLDQDAGYMQFKVRIR